MKNKVYHIRLDPDTVLAAYDYMKEFYPQTADLTPAKAVAQAIRLGLAGMREAGIIPTYAKEDVEDELRSRLSQSTPRQPSRPSVPFGVSSERPAAPAPEQPSGDAPTDAELEEVRRKLREQINEHVEKVTTPDVLSDAFEPDESDIPDLEIDLEIDKVEIAPPEYIERMAQEFPEDEFLRKYIDERDDWRYKLCVRIAYASLDPEYWGTKHAKSLINRLYPKIKAEWETT